MGAKFGNAHVLLADLERVITALQSVSEQADQSRNVYYVAQFKSNWTSILNDWFGWGEVEEFGEELSCHINAPVLTISYFDEDLCVLTIYANGNIVTENLWCLAPEEYDLEAKQADISILSQLIGHEYTKELIEILQIEECEEALFRLEKLIQVPLRIHSDWFDESKDTKFFTTYIKHDFNK